MRWDQDPLEPRRWFASHHDGATMTVDPMPLGTDWRWKVRDGRTAWLAFGAARTPEGARSAAEDALAARLAAGRVARKA